MIHTPFRARVAPSSVESDLSEDDFASESATNRTLIRRGVGAFLVSLLGLGVIAGVSVAAAQHSSRQSSTSIVVDSQAPDNTKAGPQNVQNSSSQGNKAATSGTLGNAYGQASANQNTVQDQLGQKVVEANAKQRNDQLDQTGQSVTVAANNAATEDRDDQLASDIAKAKANAAAYAQAREKAAKQLAEQNKLIAKLREKKAAGTATATERAQLAVLEALPPGTTADSVSRGGGILPLTPGTYTVGAHFGAYGAWARYHTGQDFTAACGTPIRAVATGVVAPTPPAGWAGYHVAIIHANGGTTMYAHMNRIAVSPGELVKAGEVIGYVGSTGRSFGCHLHFEYYGPGATPGDVYTASDPIAFLRSLGVKV